jgi:pantetheine-phosphate adenylyltransferase
MTTAVYALSADPITYGHLDVISRATKLFDKLIVAIGVNPAKNYTFTLAERTELAKQSLSHLPKVTVMSFEGLLVDFAYEVGATVLVRGIRSIKDLDFERNLCWLGDGQKLELETILLFTRPELTQVSSSAVKELQRGQGLIHEYVPLVVKQRLEERLSGQYLIGLTGEIGVGKSWVGNRLVELAKDRGLAAHNVELDALGHEILEQLAEPKYRELRAELVEKFGSDIADANGMIKRAVLAKLVFADPAKLAILNDLMRAPLLVRLRKAVYGKKGLIILNGALLTEAKWLPLVNNQLILVTSEAKIQRERLEARGLTSAQIDQRLTAQVSTAQKQAEIKATIQQTRFGQLWPVANDAQIDHTLHSVLADIKKQLHEN